jgi:DNA-binding NtrC family response regulator
MVLKNSSILIVDDDADILTAGKLLLKRHFQTILTCETPSEVPDLLANNDFDAILLDMNFGPGESTGAQGFHWLKEILKLDPGAVVIMITAHGGVNVAVEAMKLGATDFVAKPWQNEKLIATLSTGVKLKRSRSEAATLKGENKTLVAVANSGHQAMIGDSPAMANVHSIISRTAPTDANVLILGENGTGKELVARALHSQSQRSNKVFMSVDLGSIPETLFESELFGHKKGAFTDAREDRVGRLQAANGGTLFLDEIGNLPLHLQAKLLTVLEQRQVVPVGSQKTINIDIRVVAATNVSGADLRDEQIFRQDLLFRLNTVEIKVPPLRERRDDIPAIAHHYRDLYSRKYSKPSKEFGPEVMEQLMQSNWPGNVRALRHAIERAVIMSETTEFSLPDFQLDTHAPQNGAAVPSDDTVGSGRTLPELNLERLEQAAIEAALKKHRYNISHSAKELGLTRAALYRRMEKHGL